MSSGAETTQVPTGKTKRNKAKLIAKRVPPASITIRQTRGCAGGRMLDHVRVQIGPHGIPQPVFLQLIGGNTV
jgi:hypothetical protein